MAPRKRKAPVRTQFILLRPMHGQGGTPMTPARATRYVNRGLRRNLALASATQAKYNANPEKYRSNLTLKNGVRFAKKHKVVSRGLTMAAPRAGQYAPIVAGAGSVAGFLGFGRAPARRKRKAPVRRKR